MWKAILDVMMTEETKQRSSMSSVISFRKERKGEEKEKEKGDCHAQFTCLSCPSYLDRFLTSVNKLEFRMIIPAVTREYTHGSLIYIIFTFQLQPYEDVSVWERSKLIYGAIATTNLPV